MESAVAVPHMFSSNFIFHKYTYDLDQLHKYMVYLDFDLTMYVWPPGQLSTVYWAGSQQVVYLEAAWGWTGPGRKISFSLPAPTES